MTYRSYADPVDIFNRLVKRFKGPEVPEGVHICDIVPFVFYFLIIIIIIIIIIIFIIINLTYYLL